MILNHNPHTNHWCFWWGSFPLHCIALHWCNLGGIKITIYQCYKEFQLRTNFFYKGYNLYGPHWSHAMFVAWCSSMSPTIYIDQNMILSLSICFFKSYWHTKSLQAGKLPCCVVLCDSSFLRELRPWFWDCKIYLNVLYDGGGVCTPFFQFLNPSLLGLGFKSIWRMDDKWSGDSFSLVFSSLVNHGG